MSNPLNDRSVKIAVEEYVAAAEELYAHLANNGDGGVAWNPPRLAFYVRQLGTARPAMLAALRAGCGPVADRG